MQMLSLNTCGRYLREGLSQRGPIIYRGKSGIVMRLIEDKQYKGRSNYEIMGKTCLSVDAVASKPLTPGLKLREHVGLSCADSLYKGCEPAPDRASNAATIPSSDDTKNCVGSNGFQASASASAVKSH